MMKSSQFIVATFLSSILLKAVIAINRTDFFGEFVENVTPNLIANDDDSSLGILLEVPYPFFDTPRSIIFVSPVLIQSSAKLGSNDSLAWQRIN
jgi:hypothetical protein